MGTREAGLWRDDRDSWYQDKIRGTTGPELILAPKNSAWQELGKWVAHGVGKGTSDQHSPQRRCTEKERAVHRRSRRQNQIKRDKGEGENDIKKSGDYPETG